MTTFINTYSFMDLLKDNNYVPETDHSESSFMQYIEDAYEFIAKKVRTNTEDYGFMDLLNDNGYVPSNDYWVPKPSNDNDIVIKVAS